MTQQQNDEREFEEWWPKLQSCFTEDVQVIVKAGAKQAWLASRKTLREQLGKWHDVEEFYKETKDQQEEYKYLTKGIEWENEGTK